MKNKCLECGSPKKLLSVNYAGFDVKEKGKNVYPFMDRIEEMILPGNKKTDFLCVDCANKRKVNCLDHGPIEDDTFSFGIPPKCHECSKKASEQKQEEADKEKVKCIECGNPKKLLAANYAGLNVKEKGKNNYSFIDRIQELVLPGNRKTDFFCVDCANKRKVICSTHGAIEDDHFVMGYPPKCSKCDEEKKLLMEQEKQRKEREERIRKETVKKYHSIIESRLKENMIPAMHALIDRNKKLHPDVPDVLWEEYLKRFDEGLVIRKMARIYGETVTFTFDEMKGIVNFYNVPLFQKLKDYTFSDEMLQNFKTWLDEYDKKITYLVNRKLSGEEGVIKEKNPTYKDPNRNYDLARDIVHSLRLKDDAKRIIDININYLKEVTDYPDEWWEEYQKTFDTNEVIEFLVPLIDRNFTYEELHAIADHLNEHKALIEKWDNSFISPEIQKQWDPILDRYNEETIEKIIEDIERANSPDNDRIKFEKSDNKFLIMISDGISAYRFYNKMRRRQLSSEVSSFLGMGTHTAAHKISENLKKKRVDIGLSIEISTIVKKSLLKYNIKRLKRIKVTIGSSNDITIVGEL